MHRQLDETAPPVERGLVFDGVRFGYGDADVFTALDLVVPAGQQLAVVGLNGAGKTTLVKLLLGQIPADAGEVKLGTNLEISYIDQARAAGKSEYQGQTYYFCSKGCKDAFDRQPDAYVTRADTRPSPSA